MRLVLIRHGQTASNRSHALDTGYPGAPLDLRGREQAQRLADEWDDVVGGTIQAMAVSPLTRARQTAEPLARRFGLKPLVRAGVREVGAGDLEMNPDVVSVLDYMRVLEAWTGGRIDVRMTGGESGREVLGRALPVINETRGVAEIGHHLPDEPTVAIVAHGAINRVLGANLAENIAPELVMRCPLGNTRTCVLHGSGTQFWAETWNDRPVNQWDLDSDGLLPVPSELEP